MATWVPSAPGASPTGLYFVRLGVAPATSGSPAIVARKAPRPAVCTTAIGPSPPIAT